MVDHLRDIPEVIEAHSTTGPGDLHCRVVARTNEHLQQVINRILEVTGIVRTSTQIALTEQINFRVLPLVGQLIDELTDSVRSIGGSGQLLAGARRRPSASAIQPGARRG